MRHHLTALRQAHQLMSAGRASEALQFAERAVESIGVCSGGHGLLATILVQLGRTSEAEQVVQDALRLTQGDPDAYDALAHVSMLLGAHERANRLYKQVVAMDPAPSRFWYNLASSERSLGSIDAAEVAAERAIELDPTFYPAYLFRSELRVQTSERNHVPALNALMQNSRLDDRARVYVGYALGKELDDLDRFDEAFHWFSLAARARRSLLAYDVAVDERKLKRIQEVFALGQSTTRQTELGSTQHVFIVGLPRSGTTLLERLLAALPRVRSLGETHNFSSALFDATPAGSDDVFTRAAAADPEDVRRRYTTRIAAVDGEVVVEKLPMNYLYLGAICRALPDAKVLWMRRGPVDSCFAMYRTMFGDGFPFSYDFDDLARYHSAYEGLMGHWQQLVGPCLYEVHYEELTAEPDRIGAAIGKFCDLTWTRAAIDAAAPGYVSLTPSAAQVRRPIYSSSVGRWRNYQTHLQPLIEALRRQGTANLESDRT